MSSTNDTLQQLDNLLSQRNQAWLLGAGVSVKSNIPLMTPLTERVLARAKEESKSDYELLVLIISLLLDGAHIEHVLSHLADCRAIAERSKNQILSLGTSTLTLSQLDLFYSKILSWIAETVRWGYRPKDASNKELIGERNKPIVTVESHRKFVGALFKQSQKGVEDRKAAVKFFTTNYDTLLEDALALEAITYWDGFSGGAVGFRNCHYGDPDPVRGERACVVKLHGSVDWHLCDEGRIWRVRDGDNYPGKPTRVLIYPQATKYIATQRDPFASQFEMLRRFFSSREENVFAICGYSFGDEHVNQEIELGMLQNNNHTTIIAFASELNDTLKRWQESRWSKRLYVLTPEDIYVGNIGQNIVPVGNGKHDWWTFQGVTRFLENGPEGCL